MWWLLAACGSCLVFSAVVFGTFVPLQNPEGVEYLFVWAPATKLLTAWLGCVVGLAAAFFAVRASARSRSPQHLAAAESGRWLAPVVAVGAVALGILPAAPGVGEVAAVVGYFLYDLRWWWTILLVGWAFARADRLVGTPPGRVVRGIAAWSPAARLLLLDAMLFVGVITWATSTTAIRFESSLIGDEPKNVRYCEVWYQGRGLDISRLALVRDQPLDAQPALLQNGALLLRAIPEDIGAFARDLRNFAQDPVGFRWNRAEADNGFVNGIHGGIYQVHEPGVCALLFPGYFIDRYLLSVSSSPDGKWPDDLTMTVGMMLLIYGLGSVVLFRLLRNALGSESLAWVWAAAAMLTLPTAAFAFQLYAELPALLIILAVSNELLFAHRSRLLAAAVAGAATGALAWLHVRFLLVCLCLAAVAVFGRTVRLTAFAKATAVKKPDSTYGYTGGERWAFVASFGVVVFSVLAFVYHVSGSWWPTALWEADSRGISFSSLGFVLNFIGYVLDRRWGLLPHSLLLLGALPGLFVLGRQSRRHAAFVAVIVLALVAPAAGHTLSAAGTTPDRLVVAVVPLLIWPIAVLVRRFWHSAIVGTVTVVLVVVSLDSALAYNWSHYKAVGLMRDASLSGWKPNLAFPLIRGADWSSSHALVLFLCEAVLVVGLSLLAFRAARPGSPGLPGLPGLMLRGSAPRSWLVSTSVLAVLIGGFSAATAATADWTDPDYMLRDEAARAAAARALVNMDTCFCFTSARGHIDWTRLKPNSARGALVGIHTDDLRVTVQVVVDGDATVQSFGRTRVEFGDGEITAWRGVITDQWIAHTYRQPGTYPLKVWFQLPTEASPRQYNETVEVQRGP